MDLAIWLFLINTTLLTVKLGYVAFEYNLLTILVAELLLEYRLSKKLSVASSALPSIYSGIVLNSVVLFVISGLLNPLSNLLLIH